MVPACRTVEELRTSTDDKLSLTLVFPSASHPKPDSSQCLTSWTDGPSPFVLDNAAPDPDPDPGSNFPRSPSKPSFGEVAGSKQHADNDRTSGSTPRSSRGRSVYGASDAARVSYKRLTSPDRFMPERSFQPAAGESFRLNKDPRLLSPGERVRRRRDSEYDPFGTENALRRLASPERKLDRNYALPAPPVSWRIGPTLLDIESDLEPASPISQQTGAQRVRNVSGTSITRTNPSVAVADGQGRLLGSGTTAPMHDAKFTIRNTSGLRLQTHQSRIALALDIDQASRVLKNSDHSSSSSPTSSPKSPVQQPAAPAWKDGAWVRGERATLSNQNACTPRRAIPSIPFRVLDAPLLRDDYYCSTLAYSNVAGVMAVGLGAHVYLWSEAADVQHSPLPPAQLSTYVTSLSFSSYQGRRSILAIGRHGGQIALWSTFDSKIRFETTLPNAISCVAFRDNTTLRHSEGFQGQLVDTEDLVVGDEAGTIRYYSVEWPNRKTWKASGWKGSMTLLAKISAHTQQICGMAWSPDGRYLATGGNDNACLLFDVAEILKANTDRIRGSITKPTSSSVAVRNASSAGPLRSNSYPSWPLERRQGREDGSIPASDKSLRRSLSTNSSSPAKLVRSGLPKSKRIRARRIPPGCEKHNLHHAAAVKALAFAPWQPSLLATGGGSNDRCIRFYHAPSGSCLATIRVSAQVTSLIWSKTRREIAATFGYAQPSHPFRIAVFAWPSCQQVVAIPWGSGSEAEDGDIGRALWAISYPGAPNGKPHDSGDGDIAQRTSSTVPSVSSNTASRRASATPATHSVPGARSRPEPRTPPNPRRRSSYKEGERWWPRTAEEGCIVVACSNECVKFHEVWSGEPKTVVAATRGILGSSDILETLEGIEKEGNEIIR